MIPKKNVELYKFNDAMILRTVPKEIRFHLKQHTHVGRFEREQRLVQILGPTIVGSHLTPLSISGQEAEAAKQALGEWLSREAPIMKTMTF